MATTTLRWGRAEDVERLPEAIRRPDVVLGADLMYTSDEGVIRALAATTMALVGPGRAAVFAACKEHRPESVELFASIIEARDHPFYGTQFHPEKNAFEWDQAWNGYDGAETTHLKKAVDTEAYLASFFVEQCRASSHVWPDEGSDFPLIYEYAPLAKDEGGGSFDWEQCYFFSSA